MLKVSINTGHTQMITNFHVKFEDLMPHRAQVTYCKETVLLSEGKPFVQPTQQQLTCTKQYIPTCSTWAYIRKKEKYV